MVPYESSNMCQVSLVTFGASKNVKFRLFWNLTKFDGIARFREKIPIVKFRHSRSRKISDFLLKLPLYHFSEKLNFLGFYTFHISS